MDGSSLGSKAERGRCCWCCCLPPGVARSIESDVDNLMRLISIANILPKGLYVENAVKVCVCVWGETCDPDAPRCRSQG
jgi:aarF domain-containing kinase